MRPYLFTPLLFLLSAAAPAADTRSHSTAIQKRNAECSADFGHGIVEKDCKDAIVRMRRMSPQTIRHPGTGWPMASWGGFSRVNPDAHYRLPQMFPVGTCTILVDALYVGSTIPYNWDLAADTANTVVEQCVHITGNGGKTHLLGLAIIIINAANKDARLDKDWKNCVDLMAVHENQNTFTHCLLEEMARNRAQLRTSQRRTIEDTSALHGTD